MKTAFFLHLGVSFNALRVLLCLQDWWLHVWLRRLSDVKRTDIHLMVVDGGLVWCLLSDCCWRVAVGVRQVRRPQPALVLRTQPSPRRG